MISAGWRRDIRDAEGVISNWIVASGTSVASRLVTSNGNLSLCDWPSFSTRRSPLVRWTLDLDNWCVWSFRWCVVLAMTLFRELDYHNGIVGTMALGHLALIVRINLSENPRTCLQSALIGVAHLTIAFPCKQEELGVHSRLASGLPSYLEPEMGIGYGFVNSHTPVLLKRAFWGARAPVWRRHS